MPRGVPITAEQEATIARVWYETHNASEAARAAGLTEHAARNALRRLKEAKRGELHARALARAERDARRALAKIRRKLEAAADAAGDAKELTMLAAQINDNARVVVTMRTAHAKLVGEHAPDRVEVATSTADELADRMRRALHGR